jgi:hypothetical protein
MITALLALLCLSASACGGGASATDETAPLASTSTTEPTAAFPGSYVTSLTAEDIQSEGGTDMTLVGEWVFTFTTTGDSTVDYEALLNGTRTYGGTIVIDGDQLKITTADAGKDCQGEGSYTWTFDGIQLTFAAVSDGCLHRKIILTERPMARRP